MKYEPQINWANTYDTLTQIYLSVDRFGMDESLDLLSTLTLLVSERMANSEVCTLYDLKTQINPYDFSQINRVHALDSSVSFKPTSVDIALLIVCQP